MESSSSDSEDDSELLFSIDEDDFEEIVDQELSQPGVSEIFQSECFVEQFNEVLGDASAKLKEALGDDVSMDSLCGAVFNDSSGDESGSGGSDSSREVVYECPDCVRELESGGDGGGDELREPEICDCALLSDRESDGGSVSLCDSNCACRDRVDDGSDESSNLDCETDDIGNPIGRATPSQNFDSDDGSDNEENSLANQYYDADNEGDEAEDSSPLSMCSDIENDGSQTDMPSSPDQDFFTEDERVKDQTGGMSDEAQQNDVESDDGTEGYLSPLPYCDSDHEDVDDDEDYVEEESEEDEEVDEEEEFYDEDHTCGDHCLCIIESEPSDIELSEDDGSNPFTELPQEEKSRLYEIVLSLPYSKLLKLSFHDLKKLLNDMQNGKFDKNDQINDKLSKSNPSEASQCIPNVDVSKDIDMRQEGVFVEISDVFKNIEPSSSVSNLSKFPKIFQPDDTDLRSLNRIIGNITNSDSSNEETIDSEDDDSSVEGSSGVDDPRSFNLKEGEVKSIMEVEIQNVSETTEDLKIAKPDKKFEVPSIDFSSVQAEDITKIDHNSEQLFCEHKVENFNLDETTEMNDFNLMSNTDISAKNNTEDLFEEILNTSLDELFNTDDFFEETTDLITNEKHRSEPELIDLDAESSSDVSIDSALKMNFNEIKKVNDRKEHGAKMNLTFKSIKHKKITPKNKIKNRKNLKYFKRKRKSLIMKLAKKRIQIARDISLEQENPISQEASSGKYMMLKPKCSSTSLSLKITAVKASEMKNSNLTNDNIPERYEICTPVEDKCNLVSKKVESNDDKLQICISDKDAELYHYVKNKKKCIFNTEEKPLDEIINHQLRVSVPKVRLRKIELNQKSWGKTEIVKSDNVAQEGSDIFLTNPKVNNVEQSEKIKISEKVLRDIAIDEINRGCNESTKGQLEKDVVKANSPMKIVSTHKPISTVDTETLEQKLNSSNDVSILQKENNKPEIELPNENISEKKLSILNSKIEESLKMRQSTKKIINTILSKGSADISSKDVIHENDESKKSLDKISLNVEVIAHGCSKGPIDIINEMMESVPSADDIHVPLEERKDDSSALKDIYVSTEIEKIEKCIKPRDNFHKDVLNEAVTLKNDLATELLKQSKELCTLKENIESESFEVKLHEKGRNTLKEMTADCGKQSPTDSVNITSNNEEMAKDGGKQNSTGGVNIIPNDEEMAKNDEKQNPTDSVNITSNDEEMAKNDEQQNSTDNINIISNNEEMVKDGRKQSSPDCVNIISDNEEMAKDGQKQNSTDNINIISNNEEMVKDGRKQNSPDCVNIISDNEEMAKDGQKPNSTTVNDMSKNEETAKDGQNQNSTDDVNVIFKNNKMNKDDGKQDSTSNINVISKNEEIAIETPDKTVDEDVIFVSSYVQNSNPPSKKSNEIESKKLHKEIIQSPLKKYKHVELLHTKLFPTVLKEKEKTEDIHIDTAKQLNNSNLDDIRIYKTFIEEKTRKSHKKKKKKRRPLTEREEEKRMIKKRNKLIKLLKKYPLEEGEIVPYPLEKILKSCSEEKKSEEPDSTTVEENVSDKMTLCALEELTENISSSEEEDMFLSESPTREVVSLPPAAKEKSKSREPEEESNNRISRILMGRFKLKDDRGYKKRGEKFYHDKRDDKEKKWVEKKVESKTFKSRTPPRQYRKETSEERLYSSECSNRSSSPHQKKYSKKKSSSHIHNSKLDKSRISPQDYKYRRRTLSEESEVYKPRTVSPESKRHGKMTPSKELKVAYNFRSVTPESERRCGNRTLSQESESKYKSRSINPLSETKYQKKSLSREFERIYKPRTRSPESEHRREKKLLIQESETSNRVRTKSPELEFRSGIKNVRHNLEGIYKPRTLSQGSEFGNEHISRQDSGGTYISRNLRTEEFRNRSRILSQEREAIYKQKTGNPTLEFRNRIKTSNQKSETTYQQKTVNPELELKNKVRTSSQESETTYKIKTTYEEPRPYQEYRFGNRTENEGKESRHIAAYMNKDSVQEFQHKPSTSSQEEEPSYKLDNFGWESELRNIKRTSNKEAETAYNRSNLIEVKILEQVDLSLMQKCDNLIPIYPKQSSEDTQKRHSNQESGSELTHIKGKLNQETALIYKKETFNTKSESTNGKGSWIQELNSEQSDKKTNFTTASESPYKRAIFNILSQSHDKKKKNDLNSKFPFKDEGSNQVPEADVRKLDLIQNLESCHKRDSLSEVSVPNSNKKVSTLELDSMFKREIVNQELELSDVEKNMNFESICKKEYLNQQSEASDKKKNLNLKLESPRIMNNLNQQLESILKNENFNQQSEPKSQKGNLKQESESIFKEGNINQILKLELTNQIIQSMHELETAGQHFEKKLEPQFKTTNLGQELEPSSEKRNAVQEPGPPFVKKNFQPKIELPSVKMNLGKKSESFSLKRNLGLELEQSSLKRNLSQESGPSIKENLVQESGLSSLKSNLGQESTLSFLKRSHESPSVKSNVVQESGPCSVKNNLAQESGLSPMKKNLGKKSEPPFIKTNTDQDLEPPSKKRNLGEEFESSSVKNNLSEELKPLSAKIKSGEGLEPLSVKKKSSEELEPLSVYKKSSEELEPLSVYKKSGEELEQLCVNKKSGEELEPLSVKKQSGQTVEYTSKKRNLDEESELPTIKRQFSGKSEFESITKKKILNQNQKSQLKKDSQDTESVSKKASETTNKKESSSQDSISVSTYKNKNLIMDSKPTCIKRTFKEGSDRKFSMNTERDSHVSPRSSSEENDQDSDHSIPEDSLLRRNFLTRSPSPESAGNSRDSWKDRNRSRYKYRGTNSYKMEHSSRRYHNKSDSRSSNVYWQSSAHPSHYSKPPQRTSHSSYPYRTQHTSNTRYRNSYNNYYDS